MAYATVEELRAAMVKSSTTSDDTLSDMLDGATRLIDQLCNRPDGFVALETATERTFAGSGTAVQRIDECAEVTAVAVKDSADDSDYTDWAATDWLAFGGAPERPDFQPTDHNRPYTGLMVELDGDYAVFTSGTYTTRRGFRPSTPVKRAVPTVKVTAKWGYAATCPPDVKNACMMQAARWWKRMESAMADTIGSPETGQLLYKQRLDPDIANILVNGRYMRPPVA